METTREKESEGEGETEERLKGHCIEFGVVGIDSAIVV